MNRINVLEIVQFSLAPGKREDKKSAERLARAK